MSSRDRLLIGLGVASIGPYVALALAGDLGARPQLHLSLHAFLFLLYLAGVRVVLRPDPGREPASAAVVFSVAIAFRLVLLPGTPSLSDDIYRYIWEGGIQLEGINPYRHVPSDPVLTPYRDRFYDPINHKELPAIYPPAMQWAFALAVLLGRSVLAMKAVFVAADAVLIWLLARLLRASRVPDGRILLYAWNPLVVVEVAGSGHNDPLALCFLIAATVGIIGRRPILSMTALGISAASKLVPLLLLPLFARRVRPLALLVPPLILASCYLPYVSAGGHLFHSPQQYAERWRSNESLFAVIVELVEASGISAPAKSWVDARGLLSLYTQPHILARGLALAICLAVLAALAWRLRRPGSELTRAIFLFTGTALAVGPVLHPWYLIWIAVWLPLHPSPAWIALTGLAPLAYLEAGWVPWVEYLPLFGIMIYSALSARRSRSGAGNRPMPESPVIDSPAASKEIGS